MSAAEASKRPPLPLVGRGRGRGLPRGSSLPTPHPAGPTDRLPSPHKGGRVWWLVATVSALLAACQSSGPQDYAEFHAAQDPVHVADRIADNVGACWIKARPAFAEYTYASELTSYANRPRVLVVPKKDPHGLPKLVIEASAGKRGTSVKLFGPLMAGPEAGTISRDVERWAGGGSGCSA